MALIGTLRTKMTKWVVGAIALSMGAFIVGSDLLGSGRNSIFGDNQSEIGIINGRSISIDEFNYNLQLQERNYILSNNRKPSENEKSALQNQTWDQLVTTDLFNSQYEKLGLKVTAEELQDMIYGKNIEPGIKSNFVDSLGNFDRDKLIQYLKSLETAPKNSEAYIRWDAFQSELTPSRLRLKYENLFSKTAYATKAEAEFDFQAENNVADCKYLYIPFFAINDSLVKTSDDDNRKYYKNNKQKYESERTRSLSFVTFPITPSKEDSVVFHTEFETIAKDFATTESDSVFTLSNTDGKEPIKKYNVANLPEALSSQLGNLQKGSIVGPISDNGNYKLFKVLEIDKDTIFSAKASHILIKWTDETDAEKNIAKKKAQKILNDIKNGASFSDKAREFGTDGTSSRGGDLGWFKSGQMVKPFESAVFNAKKLGLLPNLVETQFGYHLIEVTGLKNDNSYLVATIERTVPASDETLNEAYRKADIFASNLSGVDKFKEKAKAENLQVEDAEGLSPDEVSVNKLNKARQLVSWLYRDAELGKVSEVLNIDENYVVAVMTDETKKGPKSFEKVESQIKPIVLNEAKGKYIVEKLKGKVSLEEMKALFSSDASINSKTDLKLSDNSLPGVGYDPTVVGKVFSLEKGKQSKPVIGENGVVVIELNNLTTSTPPEDLASIKSKLVQSQESRSSFNMSEELKKAAGIEDFRFKFF